MDQQLGLKSIEERQWLEEAAFFHTRVSGEFVSFQNVASLFFGILSAEPQKLIGVLPVIVTFTLHNNPLP